jgi:hypothetical protein
MYSLYLPNQISVLSPCLTVASDEIYLCGALRRLCDGAGETRQTPYLFKLLI